jgi:hypothetical protein
MRGIRIGASVVAGLMIIPALASTLAWGEGFADASAWPFRVTWEPRTSAPRPSIEGYVYNDSFYWMDNVRLRIEGLDAAQRTISERYVWAPGTIPPSNRIYFTTESVPGAASYRVSVASYQLRTGGGP